MNKSKIEWCDHTWNPITGCLHGCPYCYARKMTERFSGNVRRNKMEQDNYRKIQHEGHDLYILDEPMVNETGSNLVYPFGFEPTFHRYRLDTISKLKMGNNIFVGAMADIFGEWVPDEWIRAVFDTCEQYPVHNYLFLTKNPYRYVDLLLERRLPEASNMWYGVTVTNTAQAEAAEAVMQDMSDEAHAFLSIEPLMEDVSEALEITIANFTDWVIIGAETGKNKNKVVPKAEWIRAIVTIADDVGIPVFMKDSLIHIVGEKNMRREFPESLQRKGISEKLENKLYDVCYDCEAYKKKSEMVTILARSRRGESAKNICYLCRDCFEKFCGERGIEIPELAYREEE